MERGHHDETGTGVVENLGRKCKEPYLRLRTKAAEWKER
jgi:hypothetical protein